MKKMNRQQRTYDLSRYENADLTAGENKPKIRKLSGKDISPLQVIILVAFGVMMTGLVIYSKVQIAELQTEIAGKNSYLDILDSENVRMRSELEGKSSIKAVEEYAENILGMHKLEKSQIEYISVENGNIVDIPETESNVFVKIKNRVNDFWEYIRG